MKARGDEEPTDGGVGGDQLVSDLAWKLIDLIDLEELAEDLIYCQGWIDQARNSGEV